MNSSEIIKYLTIINNKQNAIIDMLSGLCVAYAKQNNLAIEEEECEYINDIERYDK